MASTTTAESAAADNVSKSRLLDFERVLALVGDRGFRFESGDLKLTVFPASKANSPSGAKCNWRRPVAAAAATKTPKKHRAAKREPLNSTSACCYEAQKAAGCYKAQQAAGCYEPPEHHQPGPSRQRRKARRAAGLAPSLLSLPPSVEPGAEAEPPAAVPCAAAVAMPPGLGVASSKRRAPFGPPSSKRLALDFSSSSHSSPGPALALEVASEDMYLPLVPHQNEPLPSPIITDNEYHICTRLRSTIPRSS
tara:strand:- start:43 stop:795 length:753 start_codon:yes stop_codon:yes gene_type:complete